MSLAGVRLKKGQKVMIKEASPWPLKQGEVVEVKIDFENIITIYHRFSSRGAFDIPIKKEYLMKLPIVLEVLHD
jgi:hypothetical protein